MGVEWTKVLGWLKPKPSHLFACVLVTALLLFGPDTLLGYLSLQPLVQLYRPWLGVGLLLCAALLVSQGLAWVFTNPASAVNDWWMVWRLQGRLRDLSPPEKEVLRKYVDQQTTTLTFPLNDGVISDLVGKGILRQASNVSYSFSFAYNLQPWAWRYLRRNPHVLRA